MLNKVVKGKNNLLNFVVVEVPIKANHNSTNLHGSTHGCKINGIDVEWRKTVPWHGI